MSCAFGLSHHLHPLRSVTPLFLAALLGDVAACKQDPGSEQGDSNEDPLDERPGAITEAPDGFGRRKNVGGAKGQADYCDTVLGRELLPNWRKVL